MTIDPFPGTKADSDSDDIWFGFRAYPHVPNLEVFDGEEVESMKSTLVDANGKAIFYRVPPVKQGFVGFIDFRSDEEREEDDFEEDDEG